MLALAQPYGTQVNALYNECIKNMNYLTHYLLDSYQTCNNIDLTPNDTCMYLVSVNDAEEVMGFISYNINWLSRTVFSLGILSFEPYIKNFNHMQFARDIKQALTEIFTKLDLNRVEFFSSADNPHINSYRKLITKLGGKEVGTCRQQCRCFDGKLHDVVLFEVLQEDWKNHVDNTVRNND